MERENGYYWVKPAKLSYGDKWVIATFENGSYTDKSMIEIDERMIVRSIS